MSAGHALVLLGGLALVGGWLATAAANRGVAGRGVPPVAAGDVPEIQQLAADMRARLAGLRERAAALAAPGSRRDPFRFGEPAKRASRGGPPAVAPKDVPPAVIDEQPVANLQLAGIAEDPGATGPVRTAIVSSGGQLYLVREGDRVGGRFRVLSIGADAVQLEDVALARTVTISLR